MKTQLKQNFDKLLLAFAFSLLAAGAIWVWLQKPARDALRRESVGAHLSGEKHGVGNWRGPDRIVATWPKPAAQSHGAGWLYEVFTPPVIYYNMIAKTFTVTPPQYLGDGLGPLFGLELLAVKLEAYRLQLVGYFGAPGDYVAAFVSPGEAETFLAREGRTFANLGLTLKDFSVKKILIGHDDAWPVYDIAAQAVLFDERSGAEVTLDHRMRKFTDTPLAVLRLANGTQPARELREGDTIKDDTGTYRVERIQLDPPEVVVARQIPGLPLPETKILHPVVSGKGTASGNVAGKKSPTPKKILTQPNSEFAKADGK